MLCLFRVCDELLCWVFFFFLINCVRVLGLHVGDGGDEREREREREREIRGRYKYILLCKYIILMYCIRK